MIAPAYACDCCGAEVPRDQIAVVTAYGIETAACCACRGIELEPAAAPDAREWYSLDPEGPITQQLRDSLTKFEAAHPGVTLGRFTVLGVERREPWLCIDGWLVRPDDQGPAPTDHDIPMGFF